MKKTIAILLVVVLAGVGLFAATGLHEADLVITTKITGVQEIGIFTEEVTSKALFDTASRNVVDTSLDQDIDITSDDDVSTDDYYLAVRTNQVTSTTITVTFDDLVSGSDKMKYDVFFESGNDVPALGANITSGTSTGTYTLNVPANTGLAIHNYKFKATITNDQYSIAKPGDYEATIYFNYTAI